jgi:hypothetical protein
MPETPKPTHRYTFAGSIDTMGDAKSLNATWSKIETAFDALEKIVNEAGGTLTCTPQRIGTKKAIPAKPASQNAPVLDVAHAPAPAATPPHPIEPIAGTAPKHRAA